MAAFIRGGEPHHYVVTPIGAESNVAIGMAQLGCRARWVSRLGDDELGHLVHDFIAGHRVDVQVDWDPVQPTGVAVKEIGSTGTRVRYYRSQSAARHLDPSHALTLGEARWAHVTGVTPALSATASEAISTVVRQRPSPGGRVSFDFNYRPALWSDSATAASELVDLARHADIVFIGIDEAEALLGTSDCDEIVGRLLVRDDQELVVKRGAEPATVITSAGEVSEPAVPTPVVDVTGAGDAFAAGYLAGACFGWEPAARLRLGHFSATRVIGVPGDIAHRLSDAELAERLPTIRAPR